MKTINLTILAIIVFVNSFAQTNFYDTSHGVNYTDLGTLFSSENNNGTSRFSGLNGSMGAVGGDVSAININPAGAAIFNNGEFNLTLGINNFNNTAKYYNNSITNKNTDLKLEQIGGILVFDNLYYSDWKKVVLGINYQVTNNFYNRDIYEGNSGITNFNTHPENTTPIFNQAIGQTFFNNTEGENSKLSISLAGQFENNIYAGFSLNFHDLRYSQIAEFNELNSTNNGNIIDLLSIEENTQTADGFSINAGIILKPVNFLRLGIALESPTWYYNLLEEYSVEKLIAEVPEENIPAATPFINNSFLEYKLSTPAKITGSTAVVIKNFGFINIDYTYKAYNTVNLEGNDFRNENLYFSNNFKNTHNVNIGSELKLGNLSLRGGIGYEQSPFKENIDQQNIDTIKLGDKYSGAIGAGLRFGNIKFDMAYKRSEQKTEYDFYNSFTNIETVNTNNNNSIFTTTFTYLF